MVQPIPMRVPFHAVAIVLGSSALCLGQQPQGAQPLPITGPDLIAAAIPPDLFGVPPEQTPPPGAVISGGHSQPPRKD